MKAFNKTVSSIAELKKWAEGEIEQTKDKIMKFKREEWAEGTWERLQGYLSGLVLLLEKINELEAYWKKQKNQFITGDLRKMLLDEMLGDDKSGCP